MRKKYVVWALSALYAVVLTILSYLLQMYQFTALEEVHIMLYDAQHINTVLTRPGGVALILASMCSQMFICRFAGPLIIGIVYWLMISMLTAISQGSRTALRDHTSTVASGRVGSSTQNSTSAPLWLGAIAAMPCLCLMLCIENSAYMLQGTMAMLVCVAGIWLYSIVMRHAHSDRHIYTFGIVLNIFMYWVAGSAAIALSLCCLVYTVMVTSGHRLKAFAMSITYPVAACVVAYLYYRGGHVDTIEQAFTPAMYYDMGSTYFMYLYALGALVIYVMLASRQNAKAAGNSREFSGTHQPPRRITKIHDGVGGVILALSIYVVMTVVALRFYGMVHSRSNYENQQQRYYARHGMWDEILAMPYDGGQTPYTSYRFLALAQKGQLAQDVKRFRPFISYIFENKPKVKKRDQQVYSDIWYGCDYMSAARKAAFDTDIVTPGAFNPYETLKLAEINIVYGDYAVADKLITWLEKTLFYKSPAKALRKYLYNDSLVEADPKLGPKRRAIDPANDYLSPKGIMRDLKYVVDQNPGQQTARQFYDTFLILTNQYENH